MNRRMSQVVPVFDFSAANAHSVPARFSICLSRARQLAAGHQKFCDYPCVPDRGATEDELQRLESRLAVPLPDEYRQFLATCRYLKIDDGHEIGGFDHDGLYVTQIPWVSRKHRPGMEHLVFANYWRYADGDQLMFDLTDPSRPVVAYLHEHGPLFEAYAPSFSLALWRMVHEVSDA